MSVTKELDYLRKISDEWFFKQSEVTKAQVQFCKDQIIYGSTPVVKVSVEKNDLIIEWEIPDSCLGNGLTRRFIIGPYNNADNAK